MVLVDILTGRLLEAEPKKPGALRQLVKLDVPLGAAAPLAGAPGAWMVAAGTGIALVDSSGRLDWLEKPEEGNAHRTRMNDACADPGGRFWAGSMAYDFTPDAGSLYRVDRSGNVTRVLDRVTISNGPAFDATGTTMYFADSARGTIDRFRVDAASGALGERTRFASMKAGGVENPDGMTVDVEDHLWVAVWGAAEARRYDPDGRLVATVRVPTVQASSVCLVGRDRPRLFITTAAAGRESDDLAGALFAVPVPVGGRPADRVRLR